MKFIYADIETNLIDDDNPYAGLPIHCLAKIEDDTEDVLTGAAMDAAFDRILDGPSDETWVFHNAIDFDVRQIELYKGALIDRSRCFDSLLASRLLFPERGDHGHALEAWGETLGYPKGKFRAFNQGFTPEMGEYALRDVRIMMRVCQEHLFPRLAGLRGPWELECGVVNSITRQERNGYPIDRQYAEELAAELRATLPPIKEYFARRFPPRLLHGTEGDGIEVSHANRKAENGQGVPLEYVRGAPFNALQYLHTSPDNRDDIVREFLNLGWQPERHTANGTPQLNEDALKDIQAEAPKPLSDDAEMLLSYREISKKLATLADGNMAWLKRVHADGKLYGKVKTLGAQSARMAHRSPNVAQADKDPAMRYCFCAPAGKLLLDIDAKGLEARVLADALWDYDGGKYCRMFDQGLEVHDANQNMLGMSSRGAAKQLFFAMVYGQGNHNLGRGLLRDYKKQDKTFNGTMWQAGKLSRDLMVANLDGYADLLEAVIAEYDTHGLVRAVDGRWLRPNKGYTALNSKIQGNAAILLKRALLIFEDYLRATRLPAQFLANIHDEWVIAVDPEYAEDIAELGCTAIIAAGEYYSFRCALRGEYKIGERWSEVH